MSGSPPAIVPGMAIKRRFKPAVDGRLTVSLPGETLMARIVRVVSDDDVIIELDYAPMMGGKSHWYKKGDFIPCRRGVDGLGVESWNAVSERSIEAAEQLLERTRPPPEPAPPDRSAQLQEFIAELDAAGYTVVAVDNDHGSVLAEKGGARRRMFLSEPAPPEAVEEAPAPARARRARR